MATARLDRSAYSGKRPDYRTAMRIHWALANFASMPLLRSELKSLGVKRWIMDVRDRSITYKLADDTSFSIEFADRQKEPITKELDLNALLKKAPLLDGKGMDYVKMLDEFADMGCAYWRYDFDSNRYDFYAVDERKLYSKEVQVAPHRATALVGVKQAIKENAEKNESEHELAKKLRALGVQAYDFCLWDRVTTYFFQDGRSETIDDSASIRPLRISPSVHPVGLEAIMVGGLSKQAERRDFLSHLGSLGVYRYRYDLVKNQIEFWSNRNEMFYLHRRA